MQKFHINDAELEELQKVNPNTKFDNYMKGAELAGLNGLHFRQNSLTGQYVAQRSTREIETKRRASLDFKREVLSKISLYFLILFLLF